MILFALAALAGAQAQPAAGAPDYTSDSAWLCLPGRTTDPCGEPLATAALEPGGYGPVVRSRPAADPRADCFYVYPTVSADAGLNSDLNPGPEEAAAARVQFARFHQLCRTYAPLYRQLTLGSLAPGIPAEALQAGFEQAYGDVRAAWRNFLASRNDDRPFILIGHSQGSIHLERLIKEEIEGKPIAGNMVSALLIGWNINVPLGRTVGGTFATTPLCTVPNQTGCIITYVSFRENAPPPEGALFGRALAPPMTVACTNPATLAGSPGPLDSYWYSGPAAFTRPITWSSAGPPPAQFLRTRGLVSARCVHDGRAGYLAVTVNADPADGRTDDIPGEVMVGGQPAAGWGLHLTDMSLAMGDLLRVTERQIAAFRRR